MPLPYTGSRGELNFEADIIETLIKAGWEKDVLRNKTIPDLIENWKEIIFERNRTMCLFPVRKWIALSNS